MPLKLGNKAIADVYLGDKKISKIYKGNTLVYQKEDNYNGFLIVNSVTETITIKINSNTKLNIDVVANVPKKVIIDVEITSMSEMFVKCSNLIKIDLSHLNLDKVTNYDYTFGMNGKLE